MALIKAIRNLILYGSILGILIFILKWWEWKFLIVDNSLEIYIGLIALFFTILGGWAATRLSKPGTGISVVEREVPGPRTGTFRINETELNNLRLTKREYEVLELLAKGHSNADIADHLFLSLSTVKTHVSNLYSKMNVKRRGQAIAKSKGLQLVE